MNIQVSNTSELQNMNATEKNILSSCQCLIGLTVRMQLYLVAHHRQRDRLEFESSFWRQV